MDAILLSADDDAEEKTEPFSSSEYTAHLHGAHLGAHTEPFTAAPASPPVHLDELIVPPNRDFRLLVRPLRSRSVSPGTHDNCEWVALRAEASSTTNASPASAIQTQETVLAVTQTPNDIKFSVVLPAEHDTGGQGGDQNEDCPQLPPLPLWCELYYDPSSDNQILVNGCDLPISLSRVPATPGSDSVLAGEEPPLDTVESSFFINPGSVKALSPGTWRITMGLVAVLDFRILKRRQLSTLLPQAYNHSVVVSSAVKRPLTTDSNESGGLELRRLKIARQNDDTAVGTSKGRGDDAHTGKGDGDVIMFLRPTADPLVFPLPTTGERHAITSDASAPSAASTVDVPHSFVDLAPLDTVLVPGSLGAAGCELASYRLTKRSDIASTSLSSVFTGTVANHPTIPEKNAITVKVIKTRTSAAATLSNQETDRVVVRQADTWLREYRSHEYLRHDSIVRLYGGDSRHLALYMEHVDAPDLSAKGKWRDSTSDCFVGNDADARRILQDIASALHYVHNKGLVHNDVKPANVLYSRTRGAVLCDFGLSTRHGSPPLAGGTPYYIPPEFIGLALRGPPSDVWALGITMLYVLRKIALPDARGNHRQTRRLYWHIADVNRADAAPWQADKSTDTKLPALVQMQLWIAEVHAAREALISSNKVERITSSMLIPNPAQRSIMRTVVDELFETLAR